MPLTHITAPQHELDIYAIRSARYIAQCDFRPKLGSFIRMPSSLLGILRPTWPTWPAPDAPDVPVCEVVQHGVEDAGQGGQEGLEGALVPGEGQGRLGESRRGSKMLPNASHYRD